MAASGSSRSPRRNSMSSLARLAAALPVAALLLPAPASAQAITVLPDQMSTIRLRSEEHTSELQSLMRTSDAVFCLKKPIHIHYHVTRNHNAPTHRTNTTTSAH